MDGLDIEEQEGFSWEYMGDVPQKIERPGPEEGEAVLKEAVEYFGERRGRHADQAIPRGYNPDVKLTLSARQEAGDDHCVFRHSMKKDRG